MKNSYDPVSPDEEPIAKRNVSIKGVKQTIFLYQSQLDELLELIKERSEIVSMIKEDFLYYDNNPEQWRERMFASGIAYDVPCLELAKKVGIGKSYVGFSNQIRFFLRTKIESGDLGAYFVSEADTRFDVTNECFEPFADVSALSYVG